jgi:hypothetical protein
MYIIAILFLIGCISNLLIGNYVEAVWGFAIFIILNTSQYYWDESKESSTLERVGTYAGIVIFVVIVSLLMIRILDEIEIGSKKYVKISEYNYEFNELNKIIENSMKDKKITIIEYRNIEAMYDELSKKEAIKSISG